MPEFDLPRRLAAEAFGTALLVATVVGSGPSKFDGWSGDREEQRTAHSSAL